MDGSVAELAADWIGCLLAHRLEIRSPPPAIAEVGDEALSTAPPAVRIWAVPGPAFASQEIRDAKAIDSEYELVTLARRESGVAQEIGRLYALDAWLDVLDRQKPDGSWNLLRDTRADGIYAIDFGKGLTWCLLPSLGAAPPPVEPPYPTGARQAADETAALETCGMIEAITASELGEMVASVPSAWLGEPGRVRVADFLLARSKRVRDCCKAMRGRGPSWI